MTLSSNYIGRVIYEGASVFPVSDFQRQPLEGAIRPAGLFMSSYGQISIAVNGHS